MATPQLDKRTLKSSQAASTSANTDVFVDFTTKPDGDPPAFMDTGQPVTFTGTATGWKAQISSGKLVHGTLPGSGGYAAYYQADLGGVKGRRIGCRYLWPPSPTATGELCLALWASVYNSNLGLPVPSSVCHLTITPGTGTTGAWAYWVCDGTGNSGSHFFIVKSGTYLNPPTDDATPWITDVVVDREVGLSTIFLPDGTIATVSAAEVAAKFTALGTTPVAFASLGAEFAMIEHFASANGNTAVYPEMKQFWAETVATPASYRAVTPTVLAKSLGALTVQPPPVCVRYCPTTLLSSSATTTQATVDSTNVKITVPSVGTSGTVELEIDCWYEGAAADTLFVRMLGSGGGAPNSTADVGLVSASGVNAPLHHKWLFTGLTPGSSPIWQYAHYVLATGGAAVLKAGGSGAGTRPPVILSARTY